MESENFDEDAWKGGAGPIGYLSATIGFLLSVAGCRRLPRRTDLSCAVRRFLLRGSAWLPHLFRRCRRTCLSGGSLPDEVPFGASVLGRRLLLICLIARPDGGRLFENRSDASGFRAGGPRATVGRRPGDGGRMSVRRSLPSASGNDASSEFSGGTAFATHSASCLIPVFDDGRGVSERVVFGRYPAAASDALCPTSVTMPEWAIRGGNPFGPRYPLAHGRLRFLFARVGPELAVAFRREILTFRPSGAGLLPFRDRTLARGPFQRAERLDIPARFFTFAR